MVREQLFGLLQFAEDGFHHAIVQQRGKLAPLGFRQLGRLDVERRAALGRSTCCRPQLWAMSVALEDRGEMVPGRGVTSNNRPSGACSARRTVLEQPLKFGVFFGTERCANIGKVDVLGVDITDGQVGVPAAGQQFGNAKSR